MKSNRKFLGYKNVWSLKKEELFSSLDTTYIERPLLLAAYFKKDLNDALNNVSLLYFREPNEYSYPLNLYSGLHKFQSRRPPPNQFEHLKSVENYILNSEKDMLDIKDFRAITTSPLESIYATPEINPTNARKTILTTRGLLWQIMYLPYIIQSQISHNLVIFATKYCDKICLVEPLSGTRQKNIVKYFQHLKFQQYCFSSKFDEEPKTDAAINDTEFFYGIYRSALSNFNIIYSAEISGIISDHQIKNSTDIHELNKLRFVFAKTNLKSDVGKYRYQERLSVWWLQAYLANVEDIYVGGRDENGLIYGPVEHKKIQNLLEGTPLKPSVCNKFLHKFLTLVEEIMKDVDCPHTVCEFKYNSLLERFQYKMNEGKTLLSFLSPEFIQHLKKNKRN